MTGPGFIVGYGEGRNLAEARADAAREIAEAISVTVASEGVVVSGTGREAVARFQVELSSRVQLSNLKLLKHGESSGRVFVAMGYDNRPLALRVEDALGEASSGDEVSRGGYKESLPLYGVLNYLGIMPQDTRLERRHGRWELAIADRLFPLTPLEWARYCFAEKIQNQGISIDILPGSVVKNGAPYVIRIGLTSHQGYLSLYHVDGAGRTLALFTDVSVAGRSSITFPDTRHYTGLEAMAGDSPVSRDLILAVLRPNPSSDSSHMPVSKHRLTHGGLSDPSFSYGELLESLGGARWASRFVWVTK